ncbi:MAG: NADH-quinone oxidoreductase subunit N [Gemmatimonadetes bacterium]|nr:NADH-quinone oxidoreductase subunit N [Gemmatimonadota bacterium]MBT8405053.1 NADH-quinone oxidoreductase subunit N [Gemmatimonadota bacterium]NNK63503.1 NADH-quinone oxidoreductase subunit N [Gemmatimonadota bacterium]
MTLDFSRNLHFVWALLPEIILCVSGMGVLLAGVSGRRDGRTPEGERYAEESPSDDLGWLSLVGIGLAALANGWLYGVTEVGNHSMVAVDGFRLFGNWIFLAAAAFGVVMSITYVWRQRLQAGEYYALILFATAGMMFMAGARDLMVVFLGLEVMSISVYALTAFNRRDRRSAEAGLKYFLLGAFSTGFFLYGIALVYGATGSTNISAIGLAVQSGAATPGLLIIGIALLAVGFAFKVSAVPFHMWTPDVYEGAPTPITAFMSVAVKAAAFVAFFRVFLVAFGGVYESWYALMWWLAAITMVVANLIALAQTNVKRMLAYSSVAHAGYLLVALTAANEQATAGMLFYLLVYAVMNMGAFGVVLAVGRQAEDNLQLDDYAGLGARQPLLGVILTVFLLSLAGFPGTGGFMGKIFLLQGAAAAQLWTLSVVLVLTTVVSYYYYLRLAWYTWMRDPRSPDQHEGVFVPLSMRLALAAGVAAVLFLGIFPGGFMEAARSSAEGLTGVGTLILGMTP